MERSNGAWESDVVPSDVLHTPDHQRDDTRAFLRLELTDDAVIVVVHEVGPLHLRQDSQQSRDAIAVLRAVGEKSAFVFGNSSAAVIARAGVVARSAGHTPTATARKPGTWTGSSAAALATIPVPITEANQFGPRW